MCMKLCSVVQNVSTSPKINCRWNGLLPPTPLYPPPICNSDNKIDGSPCCHWSLTSPHTAFQLLRKAFAFYWSFRIYYPCILIRNVFFSALCIYPSQSCILSASRWWATSLTLLARWILFLPLSGHFACFAHSLVKKGRRKECETAEALVQRAVMKTFIMKMQKE